MAELFIVLMPSTSERGGSKDVKTFTTIGELEAFLRGYSQPIARLEIYRGVKMSPQISLLPVAD